MDQAHTQFLVSRAGMFLSAGHVVPSSALVSRSVPVYTAAAGRARPHPCIRVVAVDGLARVQQRTSNSVTGVGERVGAVADRDVAIARAGPLKHIVT